MTSYTDSMMQFSRWPVLIASVSLLFGSALGIGVGGISGSWWLGGAALFALMGMLCATLWKPGWMILPIIGVLVSVGIGRALIARQTAFTIPESIELGHQPATVVSAPEPVGTDQRAYIDTSIDGRIVRLRAQWATQAERIGYGTVLEITGTAKPPRQEDDFNERGFLLAHRAAGTAQIQTLTVTADRAGSPLLRLIHGAREWLVGRLAQALPPPTRQVVSGMLLGQRAGLPTDIEDAFRDTGTTHLLVASGSNVSTIAFVIGGFLLLALNRRLTALLVLLLLILFVVISGAEASIIRATCFFSLILLADILGRRPHDLTTIALVGALMVLVNPWVVLYDVGFQLSFAAITGLFTFSAWIETKLPRWMLPNLLGPTLAAQLTTLPILLYVFGQSSLIAPLANVVAGLVNQFLVLSGGLLIVFPWLTPIAWASQGLVGGLVDVLKYLAHVPYATIAISPGNWLPTTLSLLLIGLGLLLRYRFPTLADESRRDL